MTICIGTPARPSYRTTWALRMEQLGCCFFCNDAFESASGKVTFLPYCQHAVCKDCMIELQLDTKYMNPFKCRCEQDSDVFWFWRSDCEAEESSNRKTRSSKLEPKDPVERTRNIPKKEGKQLIKLKPGYDDMRLTLTSYRKGLPKS